MGDKSPKSVNKASKQSRPRRRAKTRRSGSHRSRRHPGKIGIVIPAALPFHHVTAISGGSIATPVSHGRDSATVGKAVPSTRATQ
jgi:hypothetical protein